MGGDGEEDDFDAVAAVQQAEANERARNAAAALQQAHQVGADGVPIVRAPDTFITNCEKFIVGLFASLMPTWQPIQVPAAPAPAPPLAPAPAPAAAPAAADAVAHPPQQQQEHADQNAQAPNPEPAAIPAH